MPHKIYATQILGTLNVSHLYHSQLFLLPTYSVTRFGESRHFVKSIWQFFDGSCLILQICDIIGQIFIVTNGQKLKNNLIIWSHCLPTSYLPTYLLLFSQDSSARVFFFCACPINIFLVQFVSLSLIFSTSSISHSLSLLLSQALPSPSLSF